MIKDIVLENMVNILTEIRNAPKSCQLTAPFTDKEKCHVDWKKHPYITYREDV